MNQAAMCVKDILCALPCSMVMPPTYPCLFSLMAISFKWVGERLSDPASHRTSVRHHVECEHTLCVVHVQSCALRSANAYVLNQHACPRAYERERCVFTRFVLCECLVAAISTGSCSAGQPPHNLGGSAATSLRPPCCELSPGRTRSRLR